MTVLIAVNLAGALAAVKAADPASDFEFTAIHIDIDFNGCADGDMCMTIAPAAPDLPLRVSILRHRPLRTAVPLRRPDSADSTGPPPRDTA